jgi:hypothetical protein
MKSLITALVILGINCGGANAKDVQWLGFLCLVNQLNKACLDDGMLQGECFALRMSLGNYPRRINGAEFSLFDQHWASNYSLAKGNVLDGQFRYVAGTGIATGVWTFKSKLRLTYFRPNPIPTTSTYIALKGDIQDFDGAKGCNVKFEAAVTRRPPY